MTVGESDEELIGSTELARAVSSTLDKAALHPITIKREKGEDLTIVRRDAWLRWRRSERLEQLVISLAYAMTQRLGGTTPAYPAELYWLDWLDNDDFLDFCQEFFQTVRGLMGGHADHDTLADIVHAWQETAFALHDPHLTARFTNART